MKSAIIFAFIMYFIIPLMVTYIKTKRLYTLQKYIFSFNNALLLDKAINAGIHNFTHPYHIVGELYGLLNNDTIIIKTTYMSIHIKTNTISIINIGDTLSDYSLRIVRKHHYNHLIKHKSAQLHMYGYLYQDQTGRYYFDTHKSAAIIIQYATAPLFSTPILLWHMRYTYIFFHKFTILSYSIASLFFLFKGIENIAIFPQIAIQYFLLASIPLLTIMPPGLLLLSLYRYYIKQAHELYTINKISKNLHTNHLISQPAKKNHTIQTSSLAQHMLTYFDKLHIPYTMHYYKKPSYTHKSPQTAAILDAYPLADIQTIQKKIWPLFIKAISAGFIAITSNIYIYYIITLWVILL